MSKSIFITVILLCLLLFVSCSQTKTPSLPDFSSDMSLSGVLRCEELKADVTVSKKNGVWTAVFSSPESLEGLTFQSGENCRVDYGGINFEYPTDGVPFINLIDYITESLNTAADSESIFVKEVSDGIQISGTAHKSGFVITLDSTGNITRIAVGGATFTILPEKTE